MDALRRVTPSAFLITTALLLITFSLVAQKLRGNDILGTTTIKESNFPGYPSESYLTGSEQMRARYLHEYLSGFWRNHE